MSLINREPSMGLYRRPIRLINRQQMDREIKATTCHLCPMMTLPNTLLNLWVQTEISPCSNIRRYMIWPAEIMQRMTNLRRCTQRTARWMKVSSLFLALHSFKRQIRWSFSISRTITNVSRCMNQWTNSSREDSWILTRTIYLMAFQWLPRQIFIQHLVSIQTRSKWIFRLRRICNPNPGSRYKAKR